jgi:hypothetical protein
MLKKLKTISWQRLILLTEKRRKQRLINSYIETHNLNDVQEQRHIISQYNLMHESKRSFGRKYREELQEKVSFMIRHEIIKVKV